MHKFGESLTKCESCGSCCLLLLSLVSVQCAHNIQNSQIATPCCGCCHAVGVNGRKNGTKNGSGEPQKTNSRIGILEWHAKSLHAPASKGKDQHLRVVCKVLAGIRTKRDADEHSSWRLFLRLGQQICRDVCEGEGER